MTEIVRNKELDKFWIEISEPDLANNAKDARDFRDSEIGEDEFKGKKLLFTQANSSFTIDEMYYEKGSIQVSGSLGDTAYLSFDLPLSKGMVVAIIESYMKRMGQLKTLLEVANKIDEAED